MIRKAEVSDAAEIASIYNYYILNSSFTFEEVGLSAEEMAQRINIHSKMTWWVYEENQKIHAYAFAAPWKPRSAYKNTIEVSIYVDKDQHSKGIGFALYSHLLEAVRQEKFHAVLAGIALPNEQSVKFHQKLGFKKVGQLREVGFKFNRWIDVSYWELLF